MCYTTPMPKKKLSESERAERLKATRRRYRQKNGTAITRRQNERRRQRLPANRAALRKHLEQNGCIDCGESDHRCLDFDHVRGEKMGNVKDLLVRGRSMTALWREIEKCEVRCANCHRKVTYDRAAWEDGEPKTLPLFPE